MTEFDQFKARTSFIAKKLETYNEKHPNTYPHYSTIWRWEQEFKEQTPGTDRAFKCQICEFDEVCPVDKGGKCFWQEEDNVPENDY